MLTKKQLKVLDIFRINFEKKLTFSEIKNQSEQNSNSFMQRTLSNCINEDLIEIEAVGQGMLLYKLKINNVTLSYLRLILTELYDIPENILYKFQKEITELTTAYSLVIFGSYAKNKQNKDSDLDMVIIVEDKKLIPEIRARIEAVKLGEFTNIDYDVFTTNDFKKMLESKEENVGKEIVRHNLIFNNSQLFYKLAKKWNQQQKYISIGQKMN